MRSEVDETHPLRATLGEKLGRHIEAVTRGNASIGAELNEVVAKLNSFKKLDQAKDYLSDVYYERNWQKVDEYAQRLWSLVENKFL